MWSLVLERTFFLQISQLLYSRYVYKYSNVWKMIQRIFYSVFDKMFLPDMEAPCSWGSQLWERGSNITNTMSQQIYIWKELSYLQNIENVRLIRSTGSNITNTMSQHILKRAIILTKYWKDEVERWNERENNISNTMSHQNSWESCEVLTLTFLNNYGRGERT